MDKWSLLLCMLVLCYGCSSDSNDDGSDAIDTTPPTVSISIPGFPELNSTIAIVVGNQIQINVAAEDASGIEKVEGFINDTKVAEDLSAPFTLIIDLSDLESKINGNFKDYTLRIDATDSVGNTVSATQKINVDNEIPSIGAVSLEEGTVLGGDTNPITFSIDENQGLQEIALFVDNQAVGTVASDVTEFNLMTADLADGPHIFKITATDLAENIAIYEVGFVADNTGPEIDLEGLINDQIIDGNVLIAPKIQDTYSDLFSLSISFREQALFAVENPDNETYEFKPAQFDTGAGRFEIVARDALLNTTSLEIPVTILRRLLQINVPGLFFDNDEEALVFISTKSGLLLDEAVIDQSEQQLVLRTGLEPNDLGKLMLTFAVNRPNGNRDFARFKTISDIDVTTLSEINLDFRPVPTGNPQLAYRASGFSDTDFDRLRSNGARYFGFLNFQDVEEFYLTELGCFSCPSYTPDRYYVSLRETDTEAYEFAWIDASPVPADFTLDRNTFSENGIEKRYVQALNLPDGVYSIAMEVSGFLSNQEFNGFFYHLIDNRSYRPWEIEAGVGMAYSLNTEFQYFRTQIEMPNYKLNAYGAPIESFEPLNWSVDWTENDREIQLTKSSQGDILAEIELGQGNLDENYVPYIWNTIINSQENDSFKVPELPEAIKAWDFHEDFLNKPFYVNQVDIKRYDGIPDYESFLQNVIRTTVPPHLSSSKIESVYKRNPATSTEAIPIYAWLFN
ncbi:Ig-like domain-containing protein [Flagellimonas sp. DF-77]|uniref:Ig-like domain-containing protein n=1 Tax=Flagellimonas algarum TaxID=3230298 RepID=UPI00339406D0